MERQISRRDFLTGLAGLVLAGCIGFEVDKPNWKGRVELRGIKKPEINFRQFLKNPEREVVAGEIIKKGFVTEYKYEIELKTETGTKYISVRRDPVGGLDNRPINHPLAFYDEKIQALDKRLEVGQSIEFSIAQKNYDSEKQPVFYVDSDKYRVVE